MRDGWIVAPQPVIAACVLIRQVADLAPNTIGQYWVVEFAQRGWLDAHIYRVRAIYAVRCQAMDAALRRHIGMIV